MNFIIRILFSLVRTWFFFLPPLRGEGEEEKLYPSFCACYPILCVVECTFKGGITAQKKKEDKKEKSKTLTAFPPFFSLSPGLGNVISPRFFCCFFLNVSLTHFFSCYFVVNGVCQYSRYTVHSVHRRLPILYLRWYIDWELKLARMSTYLRERCEWDVG